MKINWLNLTLLFVISIISSQEVFDGLTIYTPQSSGGPGGGSTTTYLKNEDGETVHTWNHARGAASMPYLLPDSSIIYPFRVQSPTMVNGGVGGGIQRISWGGEILWEYEVSDDTYQHHHDIQPLPNGNILVIAWERKTGAEAIALGRQSINNPLNEFWCEAILELEPIGTDEVNMVWEWHLWDHLIQDVDLDLPNYGTISDHPELLNINYGNVGGYGGPGGEPNGDWMHFNAIDYNEFLDQIVVSSPKANEIFVIDHSTTTEEAAGHTGGNSGMGGDIIYRWGNPQVYERGSASDRIIYVLHSINWIEPEYPNGGGFIYYNNGVNRPDGSYSSADVFMPPIDDNGNYIIEDGQAFGPENLTWTFDDGFFSEVQSGAFRLPNGNVLITDANSSRIIEVTMDGDIVWDFTQNGVNMIARAQKYGYDLFENFTPGDVNNDGTIDILDVVLTVNIILNLSDPTPAADVNEDDLINVLDIVMIVNIILGESW